MKKYLPYIIGGIVLYVFWEKLKTLGNAVGNAVPQSVIDFVANPGGNPQVTAVIVLPDGRAVDANNIYLDDQMMFTYSGRTYRLTGRNESNQYVAVLT
jgi:hypothetical protein